MSSMAVRGEYLLLLCLFCVPFAVTELDKCKYGISKKVLKADCSKLGFTSVPQNLKYSIGILRFSGNKLKTLVNNSFAKYNRLKILLLDYNELQFIESKAFFGLERLVKLSLKGNILNLSTAYSEEVFRFVPKLVLLDIRKNSYRTSSRKPMPTSYPNFGHLQKLNALYMDLVEIPVFNKSGLSTLQNLTVLRFENCHLLEMKNNTFLYMPTNVQKMYFKNCKHINLVEADFLKPFPVLKILSLHHTYIHLSRALKILHPLKNKTMKTISFNRVTVGYQDSIEYPYAVKVTKRMTEYLQTICFNNLVLSENGIVDFEPGSLLVYNHPECIKSIVFAGNRFSLLSGEKARELVILKSKLINLELFDFSFNPIKYIDVTYLENINRYLHKNYIDYKNTVISGFPDLQVDILKERSGAPSRIIKESKRLVNNENISASNLDVSKWTAVTVSLPPKIKVFRLSHVLDVANGMDELKIQNASNLKYLDISYFQLISFPDIIMETPSYLEYLDVSGIDSTLYALNNSLLLKHVKTVVAQECRISQALSLNESIFSITPTVEDLDISINTLWSLPNDVFINNKNVEKLHLRFNIFKEIPFSITKLTHLQYLDISYNMLQVINETMRNWFDNQQTKLNSKFKLLLNGNIFLCNCDTIDFVKWLFQTKIKLDRKRKNYRCRLSNGTETDTLKVYRQFHELFSNCKSEIWLRVGIGCLVTFVAFTLPLAIVYNFRLKIAILIYRKFKTVVEDGMKKKFKYDLYVSYADDSLSWIKHTLVPKIEGSWRMKMCIAERDILAGEMFSDAIAKAISQSRHVVLVISENFKGSPWASFELDRVKYEKYSQHLQKIIVLSRQESVDHFPSEFKSIWKDIHLIEWDDTNLESGWDQLRLVFFSESL